VNSQKYFGLLLSILHIPIDSFTPSATDLTLTYQLIAVISHTGKAISDGHNYCTTWYSEEPEDQVSEQESSGSDSEVPSDVRLSTMTSVPPTSRGEAGGQLAHPQPRPSGGVVSHGNSVQLPAFACQAQPQVN